MKKNIIIELPSIRDNPSGYSYLIRLINRVKSEPHEDYTFNFKQCSFISHSAVTVLGALAIYIDSINRSVNLRGLLLATAGVMFDVNSMSQLVRKYLIENNFLSHFSNGSNGKFRGYPTGDYIGYRQHDEFLDADEIALHLMHHWLSDDKLRISDELKKAIVSKIFEIFMNAYGHGVVSGHSVMARVISCGVHEHKAKKLKLTVLDFGAGVIETVKEYLPDDISDIDAMQWALETGNSTKTDSHNLAIPRGLGFGLLKDFVTINKGDLSIYSNSCKVDAKDGKYVVTLMPISFEGTMINITINCDDRYYQFLSEAKEIENYF